MHGEDVENHQADAHQRRVDGGSVGTGLFAHVGDKEIGVVVVGAFDVVDDGHGADEHFSGGERTHEADPDFPIEAEGLDDGFDCFAEAPGGAVGEGFGFGCGIWGFGVGGCRPDENGEGEDDGASTLEEDLGAIEHAEEDVADGRNPVGRHLEQEHGGFTAQKRSFEDPGQDECDDDTEAVHCEDDPTFFPCRGFREEQGNHQGVDRQAG